MKIAFTILFVFVLSFAFRTDARELTLREKGILLNLKQTLNVQSYMENNIALHDLSLSEFLSYKVLKNSCSPVQGLMVKIEQEDSMFKDQSEKLAVLSGVCSNGVIGLTQLYINHHE